MVERQPRHHVDGAADGRQRVAQLVRKHRDEFRHLLRRLLERLDVPAVREVLRDLGEAVEALLAVVERGDDHARPEALAALAQAPALRFGAAGAPRRRELFPWHRRAILLRVEAREMLAQDLAARVPGDALGAGVPAGDAAVHVQHVDRVVGHALHQQPEALLALAQRFLVRPPPGEVAGDLGKAQELTVGVAQRGDHDIRPEPRAVLAQAPSLVLEAALHARDAELVRRPAPRHVLGRIERAEVLAVDLLAAVALQPLRAEVPRHDAPLAVEHEHRVVLRLLDQDAVDVLVADGIGIGHGGGIGRSTGRAHRAAGGTCRRPADPKH